MSATRKVLVRGVITLTNLERRRRKVRPLKLSPALTTAAQAHADDMSARDYFAHDSKGGPTWDRRLRARRPHGPIGENIAYGQLSPRQVVRDWMNSPGHRRNILDGDFDRIGVGYARRGRRWVQDFGGPR